VEVARWREGIVGWGEGVGCGEGGSLE